MPAWCGKRQAGLNNGKIHHFLIQWLIKQLLPGKIGQRQSAAPCERVLRRYDQVKGVVQGAFLMADGVYLISMIYLGCVQAMCQINLKEQEEAIQTVS